MALLRVSRLEEGMRVKNNVISPAGRFILAAGSLIEAKHIRIFKSWGVVEVSVEEEANPESLSKLPFLSASDMTGVLNYIDRMFILCGTETEVLKELRRIATIRIIKKISIEDMSLIDSGYIGIEKRAGITELESCVNIPEILNRELELNSFLGVYAKITEALKNPLNSISDIARIIEKDPALSLKLLKVANSAYYGFPSKISSIDRAVTILGGREVSSLAAGITAVRYFKDMPQNMVSMESFWKSAISCGVFARFIADEVNLSADNDFFMAGLFKDIGLLLMLKEFPLRLKSALLKASEKMVALEDAEKECFDFSHIQLGVALLNKYDFPPFITNSIEYIDNPAESSSPLYSSILHVASVLSFVAMNGWNSRIIIPEFCDDAWKKLDISHNVLETLISRSERQINEITEAFLE